MKIAIRADGGAKIGMGHIMRTLVLAKELKEYEDSEVFYVCRIEEEYLQDILKSFKNSICSKYIKGIEKVLNEGFNIKFIRENNLLGDLEHIKADALITDSYDVNEEYFNVTKSIFPKTVYIDDMNLYQFNVDFLLNQNIDAEDFTYRVNDNTKLMLGTKYVMLREEFRYLPSKNIKRKAQDVMLTVGGGDPFHITDKILSWVKDLDYNFHVVVGASFDNVEKLKIYENNKIKLYYNANMHNIMEKCDIAISACGSTLYELAACGVPTIGIIIADNQLGISEKLSNMGIIESLGWYDKIGKEDLRKSLIGLIENYDERQLISEKASEILDGNGVKRIAETLYRKSTLEMENKYEHISNWRSRVYRTLGSKKIIRR